MYQRILLEHFHFIKAEISLDAFAKLTNEQLQPIEVPHDHAIYSEFRRENDLQVTRILADGETSESEHTGRTGGLDHVGTAWYRTRLPLEPTDRKRIVQIYFGAVMSHGEVYVNGRFAGKRPYGYSSFFLSIEKLLKFDGNDELVVKVYNPPESSRWYPGAGIIRPVKLLLSGGVHFTPWENTLAYELEDDTVKLRLKTQLSNQTEQATTVILRNQLTDSSGQVVLEWEEGVEIQAGEVMQHGGSQEIANIERWSLTHPHRYTWSVELVESDGVSVLDRSEITTGFREIQFTANDGFLLNGERVNFKGVCLHHDQGPLGAIVNVSSYRRQLRILREMGVNAIRTTHNPFAEEFIQLCDELGFLVIAEAFDEWAIEKCKNGYHLHFDEWAECDLRDMIKRDRHSPSIILWSTGNEIPEQECPEGAKVSQFLTDICHHEDPTREVTSGFNNPFHAIENGLMETVDVIGLNYVPFHYGTFKYQYPQWKIYGSETASTVSSRGEYTLPQGDEKDFFQENLQISSYDTHTPAWATTPDQEFMAQEAHPFVLGEFVWTGFDYLGEPSPYKEEWPARSSYFGAVDLCGIPKDRFYLYKSHWSEEKVLHVLPHWNWAGHEGQPIPVQVYSNYTEVELFVNGRSYGRKQRTPRSLLQRYRLIWRTVAFEPGELKAVAYDESGSVVAEKRIQTAGEPFSIRLTPDRSSILADRKDLSFVRFDVVDAAGVICPLADNELHFRCDGGLEVAAVGNGDPTSLESFTQPKRKAFHGSGMVILKTGTTGNGVLTAEGTGLKAASVEIIGQ